MANFKGTKRSLLMSALALVLCVSMLVGSTFAWFTDDVTSTGNIVQSGTLTVTMEYADGKADPNTATWADASTGKIFSSTKWEPGFTDAKHLRVENTGSLALKYQLAIVPTGTVSALANVIDVYYYDVATQVADRTDVDTTKYLGTLADLLATGIKQGSLESGKGFSATLVFKMQEDAGNEYQGMAIGTDFAVQLLATQMTAENDHYGPDYDEDAWLPGMRVYNAADLQAALNAGENNIILADDIVADEPIVIPAAAATYTLRAAANAVVIDLNGKTITGSMHKSAGHVLHNAGNLVLRNGTIKSTADNGGSAIYNAEGATLVAENVTAYGAPIAGDSWPSYAVNNYGTATFNNSAIYSLHGSICSYGEAAVATLNNVTATISPEGAATGRGSHVLYTYANGKIVVNSGTYTNNASDASALGSTVVCNYNSSADATIQLNGGTFKGGCGLAEYDKGNILVTGGTFQANPTNYLVEGYTVNTNEDGTFTALFPQASFDSLLEDAVAGDTVEIPAGNFTFPTDLASGVTLDCAPGTVFEGSTALSNGVNVNGATFSNPSGTAVTSTVNGTFTDCTFSGSNGLRWCYAGETVVFINCVFDGDVYGVHFDGGANEVKFINCTFSGFNALGGAITQVTMEGCTFVANGRSGYNGINMWGNTAMTDCTFIFDGSTSYEWVDACGDNKTYSFDGCVVTDGVNETPLAEVVGDYGDGNTIVIDGEAVVFSAASLKAALNAGHTTINIAGQITLTEGLNASNVTLVGAGENATIHFAGHNIGGSGEITYKDLTLSTVSLPYGPETGERYGWYGGIDYNGHSVSNYENCTISSVFTTYSPTVNVKDCTFLPYTQDGEEFYHIFVYGSSEVNVTGGTFYYGDRAIKIYNEGGVKDIVFNISGSTFAAAEGATVNKALINVDASYLTSVKLNIENITVDSALEGVELHNCDGNGKGTVTIE